MECPSCSSRSLVSHLECRKYHTVEYTVRILTCQDCTESFEHEEEADRIEKILDATDKAISL